MLEILYPGEYIDCTYIIDFISLYNSGYRGIIFDIDNTLVGHGDDADERAITLFENLRNLGFSTCLISNNKQYRVEPFAKRVASSYVSNAKKPSTVNYVKAMEIMHTNQNNTLFVGDQIFTDVLGANRAGIRTILVKPIGKKEEIQIVLKRYLEKVVLFFYRNYQRKNRKGTK